MDLDRNTICYPAALVKTAADFAQPVDPRFAPILKGLIAEAVWAGDATICAVPWDASLRFRSVFKKLKLTHLCHHGMRSTWITRAAIAGVKEAEAMAFVFHSSRKVHAVYSAHFNSNSSRSSRCFTAFDSSNAFACRKEACFFIHRR